MTSMPIGLLMAAAILLPAHASAHDGRGGMGGGFSGGSVGSGFAVPRFGGSGFTTPGFSGGFTTPGFSSSPPERRFDSRFRRPHRFLDRRFADPDAILERERGFSRRGDR